MFSCSVCHLCAISTYCYHFTYHLYTMYYRFSMLPFLYLYFLLICSPELSQIHRHHSYTYWSTPTECSNGRSNSVSKGTSALPPTQLSHQAGILVTPFLLISMAQGNPVFSTFLFLFPASPLPHKYFLFCHLLSILISVVFSS